MATLGKCECCGKGAPIGVWPVNGSPHKVCVDCMPAGREMDALVAQKVMLCRLMKFSDGFSCCGCENHPHDHGTHEGYNYIKPYSTDIAAAWDVVEKIKTTKSERQTFEVVFIVERKQWSAGWWYYEQKMSGGQNVSGHCVGYGETAHLAICRAALKACL